MRKIASISLALIMILTVLSGCSKPVSVTLTPEEELVIVNKPGTVTFSGPRLTLEEVAKREGLEHVSDRTYKAAVIYSTAFSRGYLEARGKIYNCTDKEQKATCSFYSDTELVASFDVIVKPRTFSRMVPEEFPFSELSSVNKIVCTN